MPLPSTGWLSVNSISDVLPAMLPEAFAVQYKIGIEDFNSIEDPAPVATDISFGDCAISLDHGLNNEGTAYGLVATIIRKGAFGSIILDTLTIPEVTLNVLVVETCPEVATYDKEICPSNTVYVMEPTLV